MGNSRSKRVLLSTLLLLIFISSVAVLSGHAEDYPDISKINPILYLNQNQQFFHRPGGGYALISTDSTSNTYASLLDSDGELDYACAKKVIVMKFAYEKASLCGDILYIAGKAPDIAGCVKIERIDLSSGKYLMNMILNVDCDFSNGFSADANGKLSLVTAPLGSVVEPDLRASFYLFDTENKDACLVALPVDSVSSNSNESVAPASGGTGSSASESVSSVSSSIVSSQQPEESEPALSKFRFEGPVTVESLQKELDANALGQKLRVFSADNTEIKKGCIGTGQIIKTFLNDKIESQYIVLIPGDLDGTGTITEDDCRILYSYFTKSPLLCSSVLSGNFFDAAKISDDKKLDTIRKELYPSDLLKIKKLVK